MMDKEGQAKKNKFKRLLKIFSFVILGLVLFFILAGIFLQTEFGGRFVLKKAERILERKTGLILQAEDLRLNIFNLKVTISGPKINSTEKGQLPIRAISCERILLQLGWSSLIGGQLRIKNVELMKPEVILKPAALESGIQPSEIKLPEKTTSAGNKFSFRIDRLRLEQGYFSFQDPVPPLSIILTGVRASVDYNRGSHFHLGEIKTGPGSLEFGSGKILIKEIGLQAAFNQEKIDLKKLSLLTSESNLDLSGTIDDYLGKPRLALKTSGNLNLAELNAFLKQTQPNSGSFNFDLRISGGTGWPELAGEISGSGLKVYGLSPVELDLRIETGSNSERLVNGQVKICEGSLNFQAGIPRALHGSFKSTVWLKDLNLGSIMALIPNLPFKPGTKVSGQVELQGQELAAEKVEVKAELRLQPIEKLTAEAETQVLPLSGDLRLNYAKGSLNISQLDFEFLNSQLSLRGQVDNQRKISGRLSWKLKDLNSVIKALESSGLKGKIEAGTGNLASLNGSLFLEGETFGTITNPSFNLTIKGSDLSFRQVLMPSLEIRAEGNPEQINLKRILAEFKSGQINGSGKLGKGGQNPKTAIKVDGHLELTAFDLSQLSGFWPVASQPYLNGFLSGSVQVAGDLGSPASRFALVLSDAKAGSLNLERLDILGEYRDQELRVEKLNCRLSDGLIFGNLNFKPEIGEIQTELTGKGLKMISFQSWIPEIQAGQFDFQLKASGFWKTPVADLKISGQGLMIERVWFPYFELLAQADGKRAEARLDVPRFNFQVLSQLELKRPYLLSGQVKIQDLPLSSLAGILPEVEESAANVALTTTAVFSAPLEKLEDLQAEIRFENFDFAGLAVLIPALKPLNPGGGADGLVRIKGFSSDLRKTELLA
ncbi:MAG: hypothetical protein ACPLRA_01425, partial [Candidatus Saccharicenans sp.]